MSPLGMPRRSILAASIMTFAGLTACADEPVADMHITRFAAVSAPDRAAALLAVSQGIDYARAALAMAELDSVNGCPAVVREPRDQRVTFTAPPGGCRGQTTGTTYHGVAVAVNAPAGGEGGASPLPASPMSLRFTDFRLEAGGDRLALHGSILQTVAEPTGAYDVQLWPLEFGLNGGTVTIPQMVLDCAMLPGTGRHGCASPNGARGQLADGSEFVIVVDVQNGDDGPAGFVELRGEDTLRVDFVTRDAEGCLPYRIDGVEAGKLCAS